MPDFSNQTVVITGGGSGIGRATVEHLLEAGAFVTVLDVNVAALDEHERLVALQVDVRDEAAVDAAIATAAQRTGSIDALINAAGVDSVTDVADTTVAEWDRVHDINLKSYFLTARAAIPFLREDGGSIVNVASQLAIIGVARMAAYTSSKTAIVGFTRALALELAPRGIRVNAVCPGPIDTPMVRGRFASGKESGQGDEQGMVSIIPMARLGRVEDIARPIAFLCSEDAAFMTGSMLVADGGYSIW